MTKSNDMYVRNEVFLGWHRLVYSIAAIAVLLIVVMNTRLVELLLAFAFAGVIPGTNIVLSPDVVFWMMITFAFATIVGAWLKIRFTRARRQRRASQLATIQALQRQAVPVAVPITVVPATQTMAVDPAPTKHVVPKRSMRMRFMMVTILRSLGDAAYVVGLLAYKLSLAVVLAIRIMLRTIAKGIEAALTSCMTITAALSHGIAQLTWVLYQAGGRAVKRAWRWSAQTASEMWQSAEPVLWKIDGWLELRVRQIEGWSARKFFASSPLRSVAVAAREYRKSLILVMHSPLPKPLRHVEMRTTKKVAVPLNRSSQLRTK